MEKAFVFVSVYIKSSSLHLFLHSNSKFGRGKKSPKNKMKIFFLMHSTHRSSVPCLSGFSIHEAIFPFKYNFFPFNSFSYHPPSPITPSFATHSPLSQRKWTECTFASWFCWNKIKKRKKGYLILHVGDSFCPSHQLHRVRHSHRTRQHMYYA